MKVLVTGCAGFIGLHACERLLSDGHEVTGLDNLNDYYDTALKAARLERLRGLAGFRFEQRDVADAQGLTALFAEQRFDIVLHLAAQAGVRHSVDAPFAYIDSNVTGMLAVLEACRRHPVRHLLYASSSSVYGANDKVPFSETDRVDAPTSLYAATKRSGELMAEAYAHLYRIPATGLRFFTVYGPWGRPDMAYWLFADAMASGRPIPVFNAGRMERDFTYIADAVEALTRLLEGDAPEGHRVVNIGNSRPQPLVNLISAIERSLGTQAVCQPLPMQPGDVPRTYADTRLLQAITGFAPSTPLDVGIERFVRWFRDWRGI